ncbi:MAG: site-2 protease family protein, partial [Clostridia bacterium]|nr:site-2 protease family protein [Clostridia bacterium]
GPISNFALCIIASLLYFLSVVFAFPSYLVLLFYYLTFMNISLAVFNLIPIAPLDGSRIVSYYFPRYASFMARNGNVVQIIFIALLILPGYIPMIPDIFGWIITGVQSIVTNILFRLWSFIFWFLI